MNARPGTSNPHTRVLPAALDTDLPGIVAQLFGKRWGRRGG